MMPSISYFILASIGFLINSVAGIAVTAEKSLIRSENKGAVEVEFQASGAMKTQPSLSMNSDDADDAREEASETDMCDVDYPLGKDACGCASEKHHLILQEEMCMQAALEAGVLTPPKSFRIASEWYHKRPKGCFRFPCKEDPKGWCYFFNPIGTQPAKCAGEKLPDGSQPEVEGVPVCQRPRFLNGTVDGNDGCPVGYEVVTSENNCSEAGICLGYCEGAEFREAVANESMHDEFPEGCFIHKYEGCVYYNPPIPGWGKPKRPQGTPICNVSEITWYQAWGDAKAAAEAAAAAPAEGNATDPAADPPADTPADGGDAPADDAAAGGDTPAADGGDAPADGGDAGGSS